MEKHFPLRFSSLFLLFLLTAQTHAAPVRGQAGDLWADVVIGKAAFTDDAENATDGTRLFNVGGVLVDRVNNRLFTFDSGNNRVLVVNSLANLQAGVTADFALGQPGLMNSAGNGDSNFQNYPNPAVPGANTLLTLAQGQISTTEGGSFATMAVDSKGNLYVPDFFNNRVLRYNAPFSANEAAVGVWGQPDFVSNLCNQGAGPTSTCLCLNMGGIDDYGAAVAVDSQDNLWVVDAGNNRVLRFPLNSSTGMPQTVADTVIGQTDFVSSLSASGSGDLNHLRTPKSIQVDGSGTVYVSDIPLLNPAPTPPFQDCDKYDGRVAIFKAPIPPNNATASQILQQGLANPGGLALDPTTGGIWVDDFCTEQAELFVNGTVTKVLGQDHPSTVRRCLGVTFVASGPPFIYDDGATISSDTICGVSGGLGVDSQGNVFVATSNAQDVWRFPAPIPTYQPGVGYSADIRVFKGHQYGVSNDVSLSGLGNPFSVAVVGTQLIVADGSRILYWNGAPNLASGQQATGSAGVTNANLLYSNGMGMIQGDSNGHLWTLRGTGGTASGIEPYTVPFTAPSGNMPITTILPPLPVLGQSGVSITWANLAGITTDSAGNVWVSDNTNNRVLRIRNPLTSPVVDIVLGQPNANSIGCNQAGAPMSLLFGPDYCGPCQNASPTPTPVSPTAASLYMPGPMRFDHHGNLYISDNSLECWGNRRLLRWSSGNIPASPTVCQFAIPADRVYGTGNSFTSTTCVDDENDVCDPWEPAFTSDDSVMVVGANPYHASDVNGLVRFPIYLTNPTQGDTPGGHLKDFTSMPIAAEFDSSNNLYMTDEDRSRVLVYVNPFAIGPTFTPTPTISPTATVGAGCGTSAAGLQLKEFTSLSGSQASENFEVINSGTTALNLSQITIKFWIDDTTGQSVVGAVNYGGCFGANCTAVNGAAMSSVNFTPACGPDSTHQANWELTLSNTSTSSLAAGVTWANIQTALHLSNFGSFSSPASWYSPSSVGSGTTYTNDLHYAVYYQGNLVTASGGVPPSCRAAATCTPSGATGTATPTLSSTPTSTPSRTITATISPTFTSTAVVTSTPTSTPTRSATSTATRTLTFSPTLTPTMSPTPAISSTPTRSATSTVTSTLTRTSAVTSTSTATPSRTSTSPPTSSPTFTRTTSAGTATSTPTRTLTTTPTSTFTASRTPTVTITATASPTGGSGCGTSSLSLQLEEFGTCGSNQNQQSFEVINSGATAVTLSDITIKFWADDTTSGQSLVGAVNYGGCFGQTCTAVTGTAINTVGFSPACGPDSTHQANWEITLSNTDSAVLPAGVTWINLQTALHLANYANFSPGTGFWYSPCAVGGGSTYTNDLHYALYVRGNLVTASGGAPPSCRPNPTCTSTSPSGMAKSLNRGEGTPTFTSTPSLSAQNSLVRSVVAAPNLSQNGTPIQFRVALGNSASIQISLFTLMGEKVDELSTSGSEGLNTLTWALNNRYQETVASGLYFYVLRVDDGMESSVQIGKVVVLH